MLPPNIHSRQSSYSAPLLRRSASYGPSHLTDEEEIDEEEAAELEERGLEETLEKLGFGPYQWRLLALCGFGWLADNSTLQTIAVILPRVQVHFDLTAKWVGLLSACTMAGMMVGAVGWGVISDLLGRSLPFNSTLALTAVFGIGASYSPSFPVLCIWVFLLGTAVGGSMPTDGTLFLENLPQSKQYLLVLLSVFFSLGAVLSSVIGLIILPPASCIKYEDCDVAGGANDGWRRVLFTLGLVNLAFAFARFILFRLHESPRFLISNGRPDEAVVVLRAIATFNRNDIDIDHEDVVDKSQPGSGMPSPGMPATPVVDEESLSPSKYTDARHSLGLGHGRGQSYDATGRHTGPPLTRPATLRVGSAFYTPLDERTDILDGIPIEPQQEEIFAQPRKAAVQEVGAEPQGGIIERLGMLFVPQWRRTTILMWIIWGSMSLAYTMFNVWLPSVLESRASGAGDGAIREALFDYVLYSAAGCPGSIMGAWSVQTALGRRKSLAIYTLATAVAMFAFIYVQTNWAVIVSSMLISLAATAMYAVLYGMTPETFSTEIRGTACGTSAAISRFTGIIAPVFAGTLLAISPSLPIVGAAAIFACTAACSLALPFEASGSGGAMMH